VWVQTVFGRHLLSSLRGNGETDQDTVSYLRETVKGREGEMERKGERK